MSLPVYHTLIIAVFYPLTEDNDVENIAYANDARS